MTVQHDLGNHKFNINDESLHAQTRDGFMNSWCQSRAGLYRLLVALNLQTSSSLEMVLVFVFDFDSNREIDDIVLQHLHSLFCTKSCDGEVSDSSL